MWPPSPSGQGTSTCCGKPSSTLTKAWYHASQRRSSSLISGISQSFPLEQLLVFPPPAFLICIRPRLVGPARLFGPRERQAVTQLVEVEPLVRQRAGQLFLIHERVPRELDLTIRHRHTEELLARAAAATEFVDGEINALHVDAVFLRECEHIVAAHEHLVAVADDAVALAEETLLQPARASGRSSRPTRRTATTPVQPPRVWPCRARRSARLHTRSAL